MDFLGLVPFTLDADQRAVAQSLAVLQSTEGSIAEIPLSRFIDPLDTSKRNRVSPSNAFPFSQ